VSFVVLDTDVASRSLKHELADPIAARPRPVNDTWIAACCLVRALPLASLNVKDFADFAEHEGLQLIG
jgi:predicted nucleic acid-binding protein